MAENFSFFDPVEVAPGVWDREYFAQQFTDYFRRLVTTGVMKGESGELKVSTEGNSMITTLSTGVAYVVGRSYENTSPLTHTHDTEVLGKNRIDRIVVRLDLRTESRFVKSFIKKGVASTNPVPPDLQRDQFIYEISLAQVKIIGGQTYINANDVIDERGKTDICPWAGSKILPNFDNATLEEHIHDYKEHIPYAVATGTGADYLLSIDGITSYYEGLAVSFKANVDNTDNAPRIRINNIAYGLIKKPNGQQPKKGSMKKDAVYTVRFNGTDFILQGEGGSGNLQPNQALKGYTFTNDDGEQVGTGDNNLVPANIKKGVSIFGIIGAFDAYEAVNISGIINSVSISYGQTVFDLTFGGFNFTPTSKDLFIVNLASLPTTDGNDLGGTFRRGYYNNMRGYKAAFSVISMSYGRFTARFELLNGLALTSQTIPTYWNQATIVRNLDI
ncbi:hypothetical protein M3685_10625 [Heyndrickxia oleronia]|uniref:hypothetical protein n=1 Tax=Heyndrickxia oleronia TaxID=38875 RepID=UPI00204092D1|nr:hypothetical protein [Heyndrickxia oleronia]MCM3454398.1 hypothetical protein [Heyndrickxia oleronia]